MTAEPMRALELARAGKWHEAHELVQPHSDPMSCRVHAYLHRVEGDLSNARYWYKRAGEDMPSNSLEQEWGRLREMAGSI